MAATESIGPRMVQVLSFSSARAPELQALHELAHHDQVLTPADAKLKSQQRQRRRRANAFNSYRMPQRLRSKKQPATAAGESSSRCRKHQRRPDAMLQDRSWSNQGAGDDEAEKPKAVWLPTHVWHTKRMHMQEKYGVVLAQHRSDKSISAALEALRKKATLHDMSYYGLLELYGAPQLILEALQLVSDPAGSDFESKRFLFGDEEGEFMLYHEEQFPMGAICPVSFMWRPLQVDWRNDGDHELHEQWLQTKRQLWLWIHPAAYMEAATAITTACQSVVENANDLAVLDRRGHLCRFRLRGKGADALLRGICEQANDTSEDIASEPMADIENDGNVSDHEDGFSPDHQARICRTTNRKALLGAMKGGAQSIKAQSIFAVAVQDPRLRSLQTPSDSASLSLLHEPAKEMLQGGIVCPVSDANIGLSGADEPDSDLILKQLDQIMKWTTTPAPSSPSEEPAEYPYRPVGDKTASSEASSSQAKPAPVSWLWSLSKRKKLSVAFQKDHQVNTRLYQARKDRRNGVQAPLKVTGDSSDRMHLLVIKKDGPYRNTGGWDVIATRQFAPVLLKAFVYAGALVVGLEEDAALHTVLYQPSFPRDFPDTQAGQEYWNETAALLEATEMKKPKGKRTPYNKIGDLSPYQPNFTYLFPNDTVDDETMEGDEEFTSAAEPSDICVLRGAKYMKPFTFSSLKRLPMVPVAIPTLIRVKIEFINRGSAIPNSVIYMATREDYQQLHVKSESTSQESTVERTEVGFTTSALYDKTKSCNVAIGFCACEALQRMFIQQQELEDKDGFTSKPLKVLAMLRTRQARVDRSVYVTALI